MNNENKLAALEALLFIHGEALSIKKIGAVLELGKEELQSLLGELAHSLAEPGRGLILMSDAPLADIFAGKDWESARVQLATKAEHSKILELFVKEELHEDLSPASLEALSLISYLGPISRSKLDYIRGVNSTFILRNLLLRGLIDRVPSPEHAGAYLYKPSFEFMRHVGIEAKEKLPEYEKFKELDNFDMTPIHGQPQQPPEEQKNEAGS